MLPFVYYFKRYKFHWHCSLENRESWVMLTGILNADFMEFLHEIQFVYLLISHQFPLSTASYFRGISLWWPRCSGPLSLRWKLGTMSCTSKKKSWKIDSSSWLLLIDCAETQWFRSHLRLPCCAQFNNVPLCIRFHFFPDRLIFSFPLDALGLLPKLYFTWSFASGPVF